MTSNAKTNSASTKSRTAKVAVKRKSKRLASIRFRLAKEDDDIRRFFKGNKGNKSEWIKIAIRDRMELGNQLALIKSQLDFLVELLQLKGKGEEAK